MTPEQQALLEQIVPGAEPEVWMYPNTSGPLAGKTFTSGAMTGDIPFYSESTVTALLDALAACREDAERYRYIRHHVSAKTRKTFHFDGIANPLHKADLWKGSVAGHLDAAIDAAQGGAK